MKKKIAISIASLLSVGLLAGGAATLNAAVVNATDSNLYMVDGASVRLSEPTGLGFITRIDYDYYNSLADKDVVTGTIILPTDYLTDNSITTVTHAALNAVGKDGEFYQDVENEGFRNEKTAETDGYYEYRGSLAPLNAWNYDRAFSAVGYIGVKEDGAETYTYEYTSYSEADHSRTVEYVAFNAFVDRTATEQTVGNTEYKNAVTTDGTYSPYTEAELNILKGYMSKTNVAISETVILQKESGVLTVDDLKATIQAADANFKATNFGDVTRNGKTIVAAATEAEEADVSLNGIYNVTVNGTTKYAATGAVVPATVTVSVDVWSEKTKNVMIAPYDYSLVGGYTGQNTTIEKYTIGTYTVAGAEGEYYMLDVEGADENKKTSLDAAVMIGKPLHSVKYYEQWLVENPYVESHITMSWYFDNSKDPATNNLGDSPLYSIFNGFTKGAGTRNVWHGGEIELGEFLNKHYNNISQYYDTVEAELAAIHAEEMERFGRFVDATGVVTADGTLTYGYLFTTKLQQRMNNGYVTPMTVGFGDMKTREGETVLVDRSTKTSIMPSLTAAEEKVVDYWTENGYTISYEFVKRYSDGTPIFKGNDLATLGAYTIVNDTASESYTEDGLYYLKATATKGEVEGVCLTKTYDIYNAASTVVEYENFMHSDSQYAVQSYYGSGEWIDSLEHTNWAISSTKFAVRTHDQFFKAGSVRNVEFGTGDDENTYYALSLGSCSDNSIKNYSGRTVGYLEYDWTKEFVLETYYQYIFTYVSPRHSVEYYKLFAETHGKFVMSFKGTNTETSLRTLHPVDVSNGEISLYYGRTYSNNNQGAGMQDSMLMNVQTLISYYDDYATGKIPMQIIYSPYSFKTGTARLYEIFFLAN
ncbi:MAG: hypothetical protein IJB97_10080 [Clostridia bacterium]|nr:hypothetical protein [Clostridia bacterium]